MTFILLLVLVAVVVVVAAVAAGRGDAMRPMIADRAPLALPAQRAVVRADVDGLRFALAFRGYRMDEVDDVLDRLSAELAERDGTIEQLRGALAVASSGVGAPEAAPFENWFMPVSAAAPTVVAPPVVAPPVVAPPVTTLDPYGDGGDSSFGGEVGDQLPDISGTKTDR